MDLFDISPDDIAAAYDDREVAAVGDAELACLVSQVLGRPRTADTSFTLHAPLELLARIRLLSEATPSAHRRARLRLVAIAAQYDNSGEPIERPPGAPPATLEASLDLLAEAISNADMTAADRAALGLAQHATPGDLAHHLSATVVPLLGAAGHTPIALSQWPLVDDHTPLDRTMVRHLLRNLAGLSELRFRFEHPNRDRPLGSLTELSAALAAVSPIDQLGFGIFTLMDLAENHHALASFPSVDHSAVPAAFRLVTRRAATAMVTDDPLSAPYGWSHALTMPLALSQIAHRLPDPTVALDAALTEWCGFRMAHGRDDVREYEPEPNGTPVAHALATSPDEAAAAAWHHPDRAATRATLVDNAATSHDAHLVKYTVAAFDAAERDPEHERLYTAGAAYLAGWWMQFPADEDPLIDVT